MGYKLKIMLLDDERPELERESAMIQAYLFENEQDIYELHTFLDADACWEEFLREPADIVFLDIYMKDRPLGIEIGRRMRKSHPGVVIVFLTASPDFALEGFQINAVNYCLKPVTVDNIRDSFERSKSVLPQRQHGMQLMLKDGEEAAVRLSDIVYLEASGHRALVHVIGTHEPYETRISLGGLMEKLGEDQRFLRLNRSVAVYMEHRAWFTRQSVKLTNGETITVSRITKDIRDTYAEFVYKRVRDM